MGGYPNHIISIKVKTEKEIHQLLDEPKTSKNEHSNYSLSSKIKVLVASFQLVLVGVSPYFTIFGQPHKINKNSNFGKDVMKALDEIATYIGNSVLLNHSTDRVSCECR